MTGADISPAAVELARALAVELGFPEARFVESNLYDLPSALEGEFDVVYTSRGVLGWLPDVRAWAGVVAHFLAPGGTFFITEAHPVMNVFENEGVAPGELRLAYPYWEHEAPLTFPVTGSYADPDADVGDADRALAGTTAWARSSRRSSTPGWSIERLVEHPFLDWKVDFLVDDGSGRWVLPPGAAGELPLMFSLVARKPV